MIRHSDITDVLLHHEIRRKEINFGGNIKGRIYGRLDCPSGKRILKKNRVFFASAPEAVKKGYRPCAHCMRRAYLIWKTNQTRNGSVNP